MASAPVTHPPIDSLRAYNLGTLDDTKVGAMEVHLEQCAACREQIEALRADKSHPRPCQGSTVSPFQPQPSRDRGQADITASFPGATAIPDLPPELANHSQYEVLSKLGAGGMGVVYLARHRMSGREEVLKVMNKALLNEPESKDRFLREIRSVAMLDHPNVVKMHTALELGKLTVLVMEYGGAESLADMVKDRQTPMPVLNACYYIQQAALGLQHAFDKQMVHRDIKPHNLIVSRQGKRHVVKVLDFGLAKVKSEKGESLALTATGQPLGTFAYMAPEQALDSARADIRSDIYSLGCTLYHLIAGNPPFPGQSAVQMIYAHQSLEPEPLDAVRPNVPKAIALIVRKMMAKDPAQRYQTPAEVAQVLKAFVKQEQVKATGRSVDDLSDSSARVRAEAAAGKSSAQIREPQVKSSGATPKLQTDDFGREPAVQRGTASISAKKRTTLVKEPLPALKKRWLIGAAVATCALLIGLVILRAGGMFKVKSEDSPDVAAKPEQAPAEKFVPLFNGTDLTGWHVVRGTTDDWQVENGQLSFTGTGREQRSFLVSDKEYTDYAVRFEFQADDNAFAGFVVRSMPGRGPDDSPGGQVAIRADKRAGGFHWARGDYLHPNPEPQLQPSDKWNRMEVRLHGRSLRVLVNGAQAQNLNLDQIPDRPMTQPYLKRSLGTIEFSRVLGTVRLRNLECCDLSNTSPPTDAVSPPRIVTIPQGKQAVGYGDGEWVREGDELVQTGLNPGVCLIFGDVEWTNYDFSCDAMRVKGLNGFDIIFRAPDKFNWEVFAVGTWNNQRQAWASVNENIGTGLKQSRNSGVNANQWYRVRVSVRGPRCQCYLDEECLFDFIDENHRRGAVGFRTWETKVRFRNIKVTAPDGKVLWEGVPELDVLESLK